MASGLDFYAINLMIDALLRGQTYFSDDTFLYTGDGTRYWCLFDDQIQVDEWGYTFFPAASEMNYTGYARQTYVVGLSTWLSTQGNASVSSGSSGISVLANPIYFPVCTNSSRIVSYVALCHAFSGGNDAWPAIWWQLDNPIQLANSSPGFRPQIAAGKLGVTTR